MHGELKVGTVHQAELVSGGVTFRLYTCQFSTVCEHHLLPFHGAVGVAALVGRWSVDESIDTVIPGPSLAANNIGMLVQLYA